MAIAAPQGYSGAAPQSYSSGAFAGANALALLPREGSGMSDGVSHEEPTAAGPQQPVLFVAPASKIIPFDQIQRHAGLRQAILGDGAEFAARDREAQKNTQREAVKPVSAHPAPGPKRQSNPAAEQTSMDFILASPPKARTLKTEVEAVIFCDQQVAAPMHRFVAAAIDGALILLGFGIFVTAFLALGGNFGDGKSLWITLAVAFALVSLLYGAVWAIAGTETAGMKCTELHLITFDGFPVDGPTRALRFFATCLSFCSAGLGLLWSLVDEENLTWHDHISKTFPAVRDEPRNFVRQRP